MCFKVEFSFKTPSHTNSDFGSRLTSLCGKQPVSVMRALTFSDMSKLRVQFYLMIEGNHVRDDNLKLKRDDHSVWNKILDQGIISTGLECSNVGMLR